MIPLTRKEHIHQDILGTNLHSLYIADIFKMTIPKMNDKDDRTVGNQILHVDTDGKRVCVIETNSPSSFNKDQPGWQTIDRKGKQKIILGCLSIMFWSMI